MPRAERAESGVMGASLALVVLGHVFEARSTVTASDPTKSISPAGSLVDPQQRMVVRGLSH